MADSCEYGDEPSGSDATELVSYYKSFRELSASNVGFPQFRQSHIYHLQCKSEVIHETHVINVQTWAYGVSMDLPFDIYDISTSAL
jgi:hypothetical protein